MMKKANRKTGRTRNALQAVEQELSKWFEITDWQGIRITLAVACAHYLKGEMLWYRLSGASGSGRTELLRTIKSAKDSVPLGVITAASIRGGLSSGAKVLERINNARVITMDLAAIRSLKKDTRLEVYGLLRSVKDGEMTADYGTRKQGYVHQDEIHFTWLLATTSAYETDRQAESELGERFVDLRWRSGDPDKMTAKAQRNEPHLEAIREQLNKRVRVLLIRAKKVTKSNPSWLTLSDNEKKQIGTWAIATAACRSPVIIDSRNKALRTMPERETGNRLSQDFRKIALGLKLMGIENWQPYIKRLAWDSIPSVRARLLKQLQTRPQRAKSLAEKARIPLKTVYYYLEQLELLDIVSVKAKRQGEIYQLEVKLPIDTAKPIRPLPDKHPVILESDEPEPLVTDKDVEEFASQARNESDTDEQLPIEPSTGRKSVLDSTNSHKRKQTKVKSEPSTGTKPSKEPLTKPVSKQPDKRSNGNESVFEEQSPSETLHAKSLAIFATIRAKKKIMVGVKTNGK